MKVKPMNKQTRRKYLKILMDMAETTQFKPELQPAVDKVKKELKRQRMELKGNGRHAQ